MLSAKNYFQIESSSVIFLALIYIAAHSVLKILLELTLMSIKAELLNVVSKGQLVQLAPHVAADKLIRKMYLTAELNELIASYQGMDYDAATSEQKEAISRFAKLKADLDMFLTRPEIDPEYMKQLDPAGKGVYEIRSVRPKPSIRVFGRFIDKNIFVATHIAERKELGGWKSYEFKQEIAACRKIWGTIFPNHQAKEGCTLSSLVTGGHDEKIR